MLLFVVPVMSQQDSTDMIPPVVQLDNIDRSLKAATAMSIISTVYAATGLVLAGAMLTDQVWAQRARAAALTFGIGGIGMQTNVPILTRRAYWQINSYPFPETDLPLKLSMMKELKVARSLSQLQAFMPLIGLASGLICRFAVTGEKESQDAFVYAFLGAAAAGLVMAIPQVVLMEHVRGQVCRYKRQVNLGMTENGAGLVYHF